MYTKLAIPPPAEAECEQVMIGQSEHDPWLMMLSDGLILTLIYISFRRYLSHIFRRNAIVSPAGLH